ncbi:PfkB family carbohydrate kinase [Mesorhizobium marinum]|uniref:PfkB family carbohydrate kinase n=1 Tax=Mesorhizobium marinum TaxID=3228790 RepID=UPI003F5B7A03
MVGRLRALGLARGVITQGDRPVVGFDAFHMVSVTPPTPRRIADVTGAGDALAGAMTVALLGGASYDAALREGMAASMLAVECPSSTPALSQVDFAEALALVPAPVKVQ